MQVAVQLQPLPGAPYETLGAAYRVYGRRHLVQGLHCAGG